MHLHSIRALVCCGDGWQWLLLLVGELDELDVEAEGLQFADKYVERLGHARLDGSFALDDGFVDLGTAEDVVGLGGEELLQDVGCAVRFKGPDLHLSEALSAELRLTAQRLLSDEGVRSDGASVDLVVDQVGELEHIDVANVLPAARTLLRSCRRAAESYPSWERPADLSNALISVSRAPSNTAVPNQMPALHASSDAHGLLVIEVKKLV